MHRSSGALLCPAARRTVQCSWPPARSSASAPCNPRRPPVPPNHTHHHHHPLIHTHTTTTTLNPCPAGYGAVIFAKAVLEDEGGSLAGKRCLVTGSG